MTIKKKIIIAGKKVHNAEYRPLLLLIAESLEIERFFADNIFLNKKHAVYALVDSSEEKVKAFIEMASSKFPEKTNVEKVEVENHEDNVMKIESYSRYLTAALLCEIETSWKKILDKSSLQSPIFTHH